ncbi:MAG: Fe-S cluster assembly protein SufB, partial [Flavobacteriales bacterium]
MAYEGDELLDQVTSKDYAYGFTTQIETDMAPPGLNEDIIRLISKKKEEPEWLLQWRLEAFQTWKKMSEPEWAHVRYDKPNFQAISYYAAPKKKPALNSLDELDPELRKTMDKLG